MIDKSVTAPVRDRDGWFTSSFTNGSQTCVEVKFGQGGVLVRDTKDRRPIMAVPSDGWTSFLSTVTG
jgi:hypothetical protein